MTKSHSDKGDCHSADGVLKATKCRSDCVVIEVTQVAIQGIKSGDSILLFVQSNFNAYGSGTSIMLRWHPNENQSNQGFARPDRS